jgi:hypothetical protein
VSLSGSGLFTTPDTAVLAPRRLNLDLALDNQDRDPLRMDILDLSIRWNYGMGHRSETYGGIVVSRAVALAERTTLFPPPVDIVLQEGTPIPSRPYYPLYAPIPYVNRTGTSQLGQFVPGDLVIGGKLRVVAENGLRPALAVSGELKLPLTKDLKKLQAGAGTGAFDQTIKVTGEWRYWRESLVSSVAFTHVGQPSFGDRVIVLGSSGAGRQTDESLLLANRLILALGLRHVLSARAALVAELTRVVEVGGRTSALYAAGPLDLSLGAQLRWRHLHLTLGVRYHANSVPSFATHASPLAGLVDMTNVSDAELQSYLTAIGAAGALPYLRDRSQRAVQVPVNGPPLPPGARVLDPYYTVRSHDRIASVFIWGWSFGTARRH